MKRCTNCRTEVQDDVHFCPYCGSSGFEETASQQNCAPQQNAASQQNYVPQRNYVPQQNYTPQSFTPQQPAQPSQRNGLAIAALVLAIIPFTSFIGLILGIVSLSKSKRLLGSGKGQSIAAIIVGAALLPITLGAIAAILIPVFFNVANKSNYKAAYSDARNAISIYVAENTTGENGGAVFGLDGEAWVKVEKASTNYYFHYDNNRLQDTDYEKALDSTGYNYYYDYSVEKSIVVINDNVTIKP